MDAIKKRMQVIKLEMENAIEKANTFEMQAKNANLRAEKV